MCRYNFREYDRKKSAKKRRNKRKKSRGRKRGPSSWQGGYGGNTDHLYRPRRRRPASDLHDDYADDYDDDHHQTWNYDYTVDNYFYDDDYNYGGFDKRRLDLGSTDYDYLDDGVTGYIATQVLYV